MTDCVKGKNQLERLLYQYGQDLMIKNKSYAFLTSYLNPCRQFVEFLNQAGVNEAKAIEKSHVVAFQQFLYDSRDFKRSSIVTFMKLIRYFFDFMVDQGELVVNIVKDVDVLPAPQAPVKQLAHFYTYDEIMRRYISDQEKWVSFYYLNQVKKHLNGFIKFLLANEIGSVYVVTECNLMQYRDYLWSEREQLKETALVARSQVERLRCVIKLFRYLHKEGILKLNPAQSVVWDIYYKEIIEKAKVLPSKPKVNNDLTELEILGDKFCKRELAKNKSSNTVKTYKKGVKEFIWYLESEGILNLAQVTKRHLEEYFNYVSVYVGERGNPISNGYKNHLIWTVKLFFRYLVRHEYLRADPSEDMETFKEERGLPRTCMNEREVEIILKQPELNRDPLSMRDKAIMEVLFSTGVRVNELSSLNIEDIDILQGMIRINNPKGGSNYQRVIPIGDKAIDYVQGYLKDARPALYRDDSKALFVSYAGQRLKNGAV